MMLNISWISRFLNRRSVRLQHAVQQVPSSIRQVGKVCTFGVRSRVSDNVKLPDHIKEFNVFLGEESEPLIKAFVQSSYPQTVEVLSVGDSSDSTREYGMADYSKITQILATVDYPNLKVLHLGVWELLCNAHCLYGKLGNVTKLLQRMPNLERLYLYGAFELDYPIRLNRLDKLIIKLDDDMTGINSGYITQNTFNYILNSDFPSLKLVYLDLDLDDPLIPPFEGYKYTHQNIMDYTFTQPFLSGKTWSGLKELYLSGGYLEGEIDKLKSSPLVINNEVKIEVHDGCIIR